jgi:hypothetical protein
MPSVSPEKPMKEENIKADESWEQPGQEGEISMVASSIASASGVMETDDEEYDVDQSLHYENEDQEDSWNGTPFIISSPLNLPEGDSRDISAHDLDPSNTESESVVETDERSREWAITVPDDMSNLMNEKWSPTDPSFSISDPPPRNTPPLMPRPTRNLSFSRTFQRSPSTSLTEVEGNSSNASTDIMATIRKRVSPPRERRMEMEMEMEKDDSFVPLAPGTPTPAATRPIGSIFAEMSAEQADMSWSLPGDDGDSPLRSTIYGQDASALDLPPLSARSSDKRHTPQAGDKTEFFDCSTSSGFHLSPLASSAVAQSPTPSRLVGPTKNLFEAQNAHTRALVEEVKLYRDLASRLHAEVVERDGVLADLNDRVLEAEVLKSQVATLKDEVDRLRESKDRSREESREMSASPLAVKSARSYAQEGDRTTVVQAETRDLEIRLSKSLADQEMLQKQMNEIRQDNRMKDQKLQDVQQAMMDLEDRHRDQLISSRQTPPPDTRMQAELEQALGRCSDLEFELTRVTDLASDLQVQVQDMREVKAADEEEIDRLNAIVEGTRESKRSEEEMRLKLEEMERRVEMEMRRREEMENYMKEERDAKKRMGLENREVSLMSWTWTDDSSSNPSKLLDYNSLIPILPVLIRDYKVKSTAYVRNPLRKIWKSLVFNEERMN